MSCLICHADIAKQKSKKAVNNVAGIESANAAVDTKILTVTTDEKVTNEAVIAAVSEAGYTAEKR
ncbi:heavy-metal-associated domain-containing protein [Pisciglobus halotolerans]|uniref:heavy-metal-associated domain-containing protein n=1 Tax=Pisciglobus halotolerans TaxID=745365 RepID=UPI001FE1C4F0|nr:heavy metal-associated domain-containing protein [Pisciglobus halotolerans]